MWDYYEAVVMRCLHPGCQWEKQINWDAFETTDSGTSGAQMAHDAHVREAHAA